MSHSAVTWAYGQKVGNCGAKAVLVALASFADEDGSCYPGQDKLAAMTDQSVRSVSRHVEKLEAAGYIVRKRRFLGDGHRTSDRYYLRQPPANLTSGQIDHMPNPTRPPANLSGYPLVEPSEELPDASRLPADAGEPPTDTQRSKKITDTYAALVPLCRWPAVNGIVVKAIRTGKYADEEIRDALLRLAGEGRPVSVDVLRVELEGLPPAARNGNSRADRSLAVRDRLRAKSGAQ